MLSLLLFPLTQAILLALAGLWLLRLQQQRIGKSVIFLGVAWLYLASTAGFADALMGLLEREYRPKAMSVVPTAEAIVVLGGATRGDTHWSSYGDLNQAADRLLHAVALFKAGKAPVVVVSGGAAPGDRPEADIMEQILVTMGVPAKQILKESNSRTTYDNAVYAAVILNGKGLRRIHLVTSAWHMRRALPLFEGQGLEVLPAPTDYQRRVASGGLSRWLPTADDLSRSTYAIKEFAGYQVYRYRGWL